MTLRELIRDAVQAEIDNYEVYAAICHSEIAERAAERVAMVIDATLGWSGPFVMLPILSEECENAMGWVTETGEKVCVDPQASRVVRVD